jgi:hypothetical protein
VEILFRRGRIGRGEELKERVEEGRDRGWKGVEEKMGQGERQFVSEDCMSTWHRGSMSDALTGLIALARPFDPFRFDESDQSIIHGLKGLYTDSIRPTRQRLRTPSPTTG